MSITARLTEQISSLTLRDIPAEALRAARHLTLDGISVAVAGARIETAPGILLAHAQEEGGKPVASCLGLGVKLPATRAALINGASMHVLDYEPMWLPSTHALSPALAPVLALAEKLGAPGDEVAVALLKGIEIQGWLREAAGHEESHSYRFHPPGSVGPIGAAVAAAHLLGLDAKQLAVAIGIASSRCGGLFSNIGTMTKSAHCAYAAELGLESAMLAARGFTGSKTTFDPAPQDYAKAFMPEAFDPELLLAFGKSWRVLDPGYAIKIFPAKFTTHYAITAGIAAHPQIPSADAIKAVRMKAADVPSSNRPRPANGLEGKFSLQYTAAAAILDGKVGLSTFTDRRLERADMQALLGKISVDFSREISSGYTKGRHLTLEVDLADGHTIKTRCDAPRGSWGAPAITEEEIVIKARDCLETWLPATAIDEIVAKALSVDALDAPAVARLIGLASGTL